MVIIRRLLATTAITIAHPIPLSDYFHYLYFYW